MTIGKSITGGVYPASFVLGDSEVMSLIDPYESASTFATGPMATAAAEAAIAVIDDERLVDRASRIGATFERIVSSWSHRHIDRASSRGADLRIWIREDHPSGRVTARRICALCLQKGVLLYPKGNIMRMSPPIVIKDEDLDVALGTIKAVLDIIVDVGLIPGEHWPDASS